MIASAYPRIDVSGVRRSWLIESRNCWSSRRARSRLAAIALTARDSSSSSSPVPSALAGRRVARSPVGDAVGGRARLTDRASESASQRHGDRRPDHEGDRGGDEEPGRRRGEVGAGRGRDDGDGGRVGHRLRRGSPDEVAVGATRRAPGLQRGDVDVGIGDAVGQLARHPTFRSDEHELDAVDAQRPAQLAQDAPGDGLLAHPAVVGHDRRAGHRLGLLAQPVLRARPRLPVSEADRHRTGDEQRHDDRDAEGEDDAAGHVRVPRQSRR